MIAPLVERGHRAVAGIAVLGEIGAFITGDRLQQIGCLVATGAVWLSHFAWDQRRKRREAEAEDRRNRNAERAAHRANRLLDALEKRVRADVSDGKDIRYPELVHLLVDRDAPERYEAAPPESAR